MTYNYFLKQEIKGQGSRLKFENVSRHCKIKYYFCKMCKTRFIVNLFWKILVIMGKAVNNIKLLW